MSFMANMMTMLRPTTSGSQPFYMPHMALPPHGHVPPPSLPHMTSPPHVPMPPPSLPYVTTPDEYHTLPVPDLNDDQN